MKEITGSELTVASDGLELRGGLCRPREPRGVVVLLHGLPSTAPPDPDDDGYPGFAARFARRGWAAAWIDMRAVRSSPGWFSIEGWVRDAGAGVHAARNGHGLADLPLALVGSSAGGAVSAEAARRGAPISALVLLAAPAAWISFAGDAHAGLRRVGDTGMALPPEALADPTSWAAEFERVAPEDSIRDVDVPTLVVHGDVDDVVPVDHAYRIARASARAQLVVLPGAPHRLRRHDGIVDLVVGWLERVL
jgi:dipeptidyl aminopeptidase/acylaminoacyl peptidase